MREGGAVKFGVGGTNASLLRGNSWGTLDPNSSEVGVTATVAMVMQVGGTVLASRGVGSVFCLSNITLVGKHRTAPVQAGAAGGCLLGVVGAGYRRVGREGAGVTWSFYGGFAGFVFLDLAV